MRDGTHQFVFASALRLAWAALLLIIALFPGAGLALAQGPDTATGPTPAAPDVTYELRAWTVDGGGVSYAAGNDYALGDTVGQPDAAAPRSGGSYTLLSGFWQPSCTAAAVPVTIGRSGSDVILTWTHGTVNQAYYIHRDTTPYFTPSAATRQGGVTAAPWEFRDLGVLGNVSVSYTYLVRPACGAAYVDAGRHAEFEFGIVPGSP